MICPKCDNNTFQSPLGEVVKETKAKIPSLSILTLLMFQSPLGEVVKETLGVVSLNEIHIGFQSPLGEVVKET